jgi:RIO kinase 1
LVHADFSEYNILYHLGHLVVIDVSQSVEQDHPAAFDFLRQDIKNADDFFRRLGVDTLGLTRTFNFVTGRSWVEGRQETDEDVLAEAERLVREVEEAEDDVEEEEETDHSALPGAKKANKPKVAKPSESDEAVFAQAYIPRALDQVYDPERDVAKVLRGEGDGLIYADITGVAKIRLDEQGNPEGEEDEEEEEGSEDGSDGDSGEEEEGEEGARRPRGKKHEDRDEKKVRHSQPLNALLLIECVC